MASEPKGRGTGSPASQATEEHPRGDSSPSVSHPVSSPVESPSSSQRSGQTGSTDEDGSKSAPAVNAIVAKSPCNTYGRTDVVCGRGASKIVYRAVDLEDSKLVAWHEISLTDLPDDEQERVAKEARVLSTLSHPHLIECLTSFLDMDRRILIFVTPLASSDLESFATQKFKNTLSVRVLRSWTRQILEGIAYLHAQHPPIIHRDIKPANILRSHDGGLKIADFGTAIASHLFKAGSTRAKDTAAETPAAAAAPPVAAEAPAAAVTATPPASSSSSSSSSSSARDEKKGEAAVQDGASGGGLGGMGGTPNFMPPEAFEGQIDRSADTYALGMSVYQLATGQVPYCECANVGQIFRKLERKKMPAQFKFIRQACIRDFIRACVRVRDDTGPLCFNEHGKAVPVAETPGPEPRRKRRRRRRATAAELLTHPFVDLDRDLGQDDETCGLVSQEELDSRRRSFAPSHRSTTAASVASSVGAREQPPTSDPSRASGARDAKPAATSAAAAAAAAAPPVAAVAGEGFRPDRGPALRPHLLSETGRPRGITSASMTSLVTMYFQHSGGGGGSGDDESTRPWSPSPSVRSTGFQSDAASDTAPFSTSGTGKADTQDGTVASGADVSPLLVRTPRGVGSLVVVERPLALMAQHGNGLSAAATAAPTAAAADDSPQREGEEDGDGDADGDGDGEGEWTPGGGNGRRSTPRIPRAVGGGNDGCSIGKAMGRVYSTDGDSAASLAGADDDDEEGRVAMSARFGQDSGLYRNSGALALSAGGGVVCALCGGDAALSLASTTRLVAEQRDAALPSEGQPRTRSRVILEALLLAQHAISATRAVARLAALPTAAQDQDEDVTENQDGVLAPRGLARPSLPSQTELLAWVHPHAQQATDGSLGLANEGSKASRQNPQQEQHPAKTAKRDGPAAPPSAAPPSDPSSALPPYAPAGLDVPAPVAEEDVTASAAASLLTRTGILIHFSPTSRTRTSHGIAWAWVDVLIDPRKPSHPEELASRVLTILDDLLPRPSPLSTPSRRAEASRAIHTLLQLAALSPTTFSCSLGVPSLGWQSLVLLPLQERARLLRPSFEHHTVTGATRSRSSRRKEADTERGGGDSSRQEEGADVEPSSGEQPASQSDLRSVSFAPDAPEVTSPVQNGSNDASPQAGDTAASVDATWPKREDSMSSVLGDIPIRSDSLYFSSRLTAPPIQPLKDDDDDGDGDDGDYDNEEVEEDGDDGDSDDDLDVLDEGGPDAAVADRWGGEDRSGGIARHCGRSSSGPLPEAYHRAGLNRSSAPPVVNSRPAPMAVPPAVARAPLASAASHQPGEEGTAHQGLRISRPSPSAESTSQPSSAPISGAMQPLASPEEMPRTAAAAPSRRGRPGVPSHTPSTFTFRKEEPLPSSARDIESRSSNASSNSRLSLPTARRTDLAAMGPSQVAASTAARTAQDDTFGSLVATATAAMARPADV